MSHNRIHNVLAGAWRKPAVLIAGLFFVGFGFLFIMSASAERLPIRTHVAGVALGTMTYQDAATVLQQHLDRFELIKTQYVFDNHTWDVKNSELGLSLDAATILDRVIREQNQDIIQRFFFTIQNLGGLYNRDIELFITDDQLNGFIRRNFDILEQKPQDADVKKNDLRRELELIEADTGLIVDRDALRAAFHANLAQLTSDPIVLKRVEVLPLIATDRAEQARAIGQTMMDRAPYELSNPYTDETIAVEVKNVFEWLRFLEGSGVLVALDRDAIKQFVESNTEQFALEPVNARLAGQIGEPVTVAIPARDGRTVNGTGTIAALESLLLDDTTPETTADIVFDIKPATVSERTLPELGIETLISVGQSDFAGSSASRAHNIAVAKETYDGILIAPQEQFSFTGRLGPVDASTGYKPELVIKNGQTIPEYGGGICQVSTTLFRSAVQAGLPIDQRSPHSYVVRYYGEPGFDATIYPDNPDLKFTNAMAGHIYIQAEIDGTDFTYSIFGPDENIETKIIGPVVYEVGEGEQEGELKTYVRQEVYKNGELVREKTFWSHYRSPKNYPVVRNPLE